MGQREHENKIEIKSICNNEHENNVKEEVKENEITNAKEDVKTAAQIQKENIFEKCDVSDKITEHTTSEFGMNIDRKNIDTCRNKFMIQNDNRQGEHENEYKQRESGNEIGVRDRKKLGYDNKKNEEVKRNEEKKEKLKKSNGKNKVDSTNNVKDNVTKNSEISKSSKIENAMVINNTVKEHLEENVREIEDVGRDVFIININLKEMEKNNMSKNSDNYRDKPGIKNEIEQEENKNEYVRECGKKIETGDEKKGEYDITMIEEVKDKDMDKDKEKVKENDKEKVSATNDIEKSVLRDIEISENGRENTLEMESFAEVENDIEI